jgi:hypothetical protein
MYNLATVLLRNNVREEGQQFMMRFQALRQSGAATNIGQNYLEQGRYAEAIVSTGAESELVDKTAPKVIFQKINVGLPVSTSANRNMKNAADPSTAFPSPRAATLFDFDNDGDSDLIQTVNDTPRLFRNDAGKFVDATRTAGDLNKSLSAQSFGVVSGDYDNDNFADLLVFGSGQTTLFRSNGRGGFQNVTEAAKIPATSVTSISGAFVDADHDGDLDIFLSGFSLKEKTLMNQPLISFGATTETALSPTFPNSLK